MALSVRPAASSPSRALSSSPGPWPGADSSPSASEETYHDHFCQVSSTVCVVASGELGSVGCAPTTGYDTITGLGSPRAGIDAALAKQ